MIVHGASPRSPYPWVVVLILTMTFAVSLIDRQVLNLLVDPIRASLLISDTEFSLFQGLAFMVAFVLFSPIVGGLVDRVHRRNLLMAAVVIWSLCTVACGLSTSFAMLFVARCGVGIAEAVVTPASWSLLADMFDQRRLPRALSIFQIGPFIGGGLALIIGGLLVGVAPGLISSIPLFSGLEPWQLVFIAAGLPGLPFALILLIVREPVRGSTSTYRSGMTLQESLTFIWQRRRFYLRFCLGLSGTITSMYALPAWMPAVLIRTLKADPARVGVDYGLVGLIAGVIGVLAGPVVGAMLTARYGPRSIVYVPVLAAVGLIPAGLAIGLANTYAAGLAIAAVATFLFCLPQAMSAAAFQIATPAGMRGLVASIYAFIVASIGLVVGPTLVAFLTDHVFREPARVDISLGIVVSCAAIFATWQLLGAAPHYQPLDESAPPGEAAR